MDLCLMLHVSSGDDEPKILHSSSHLFCLRGIGVDVSRHDAVGVRERLSIPSPPILAVADLF